MAKNVTEFKKTTELRGVVDDGTREIPIVNKFGKLICNIYIRPADYSIIDRFQDLNDKFSDIVAPLKDIGLNNDGTASVDKDWEVLKAVEVDLKREIDELFDMEEADEIFAKRNPFSSVHGVFFCEIILTAIGEVISQAITEEAELSKKRMSKYLGDITPADGGNADVGDSTENS